MSYQLPESLSFEEQEEYCERVEGGLLASGELKPTGEPWDAAAEAVLWREQGLTVAALKAQRSEARRARAFASQRVKVLDTLHDTASKLFAGAVLMASDRNPSRSPYKDVYPDTNATQINRLAPAREVSASRVVLGNAAVLGIPSLAAPAAEYGAATDRLEQADAARSAAELALRPFEMRRLQSVGELERQIEKSESRLRASFPGNESLVRAIFSPHQDDRRPAASTPPAGLDAPPQAQAQA